MSTNICQETNPGEAIKNTLISGSPRNTSTRKSLDNQSMIARDHDMDGYKKEDTVSVTLIGQEDFPDGGLRAWLIVAGATFTTFSTFGYANSWGVFQEYYELTLMPNQSPSSISWIGSAQYFLVLFPGLFVGRLFDLGYFRIPFAISSIVMILANFLVAHCTQYWHFLLCQGFTIGLAAGMLFGPIIGVLSHWFKSKRGLALGVIATGSSLGGVIFPIATRNLIPRVGFGWTMRILGFILVFSMGFANLTLRTRLPPKNVVGGIFNPGAFKSAPYTVWCASAFTTFLGIYTVLTYIDVAATEVGISSEFAFYLVAIANGSSTVGRCAAGAITDHLATINTMVPLTLLAALITYIWPLARSQGSLIAVAVTYGIASGVYAGLVLAPAIALGDVSDVGRRVGMASTILAFGALLGPPISGAINSASGGYQAVGYYAGTVVVLGISLMLLTRHLVLGKLRGKF